MFDRAVEKFHSSTLKSPRNISFARLSHQFIRAAIRHKVTKRTFITNALKDLVNEFDFGTSEAVMLNVCNHTVHHGALSGLVLFPFENLYLYVKSFQWACQIDIPIDRGISSNRSSRREAMVAVIRLKTLFLSHYLVNGTMRTTRVVNNGPLDLDVIYGKGRPVQCRRDRDNGCLARVVLDKGAVISLKPNWTRVKLSARVVNIVKVMNKAKYLLSYSLTFEQPHQMLEKKKVQSPLPKGFQKLPHLISHHSCHCLEEAFIKVLTDSILNRVQPHMQSVFDRAEKHLSVAKEKEDLSKQLCWQRRSNSAALCPLSRALTFVTTLTSLPRLTVDSLGRLAKILNDQRDPRLVRNALISFQILVSRTMFRGSQLPRYQHVMLLKEVQFLKAMARREAASGLYYSDLVALLTGQMSDERLKSKDHLSPLNHEM